MSSSETTNHFTDVVKYIDNSRKTMSHSTAFFDTMKDDSLSPQQRMSFMPYMLFFSLGSPDIKTLMMRFEKPQGDLNVIESKVNNFINEDNFHYNFYLNDLERLGYSIDKFGSTSAVVRHVFSEESIPTRRLVYTIGSYIDPKGDQLIALAIPEIIESGLFDLFTTVYKYIVKSGYGEPFESLEYFGDTHIKLEQNHTVTSWFAPGHPDDAAVANIAVPKESFGKITRMVDDIMRKFKDMYAAFGSIIKSNKDIRPEKFDIDGWPHIDEISSGKTAPLSS